MKPLKNTTRSLQLGLLILLLNGCASKSFKNINMENNAAIRFYHEGGSRVLATKPIVVEQDGKQCVRLDKNAEIVEASAGGFSVLGKSHDLGVPPVKKNYPGIRIPYYPYDDYYIPADELVMVSGYMAWVSGNWQKFCKPNPVLFKPEKGKYYVSDIVLDKDERCRFNVDNDTMGVDGFGVLTPVADLKTIPACPAEQNAQ
ncbi:hypothetical protein [Hydromonas duriensis]|uniref:Uncharacterized protein n=1 Tax=Hydromonas duriensis TaxID=1527608 RepID=A0A4R6Y341_9BURK|nr:hypothetical protein [Hydromonas duriensis]TDR30966.1 hypothetical protein DFR44_1143 [Hydromonas duriensis]